MRFKPQNSPESRVNLLLWAGVSCILLQSLVLFARAIPLRSVAVLIAPICEEVGKGSMAAFLAFELSSISPLRDKKFKVSLASGAGIGLSYGIFEFLTKNGGLLALETKLATHPIWSAVACLGMLLYWKNNRKADLLAIVGASVLAHAVWNGFVSVSLAMGWVLGTFPLLLFLMFFWCSRS